MYNILGILKDGSSIIIEADIEDRYEAYKLALAYNAGPCHLNVESFTVESSE